MHFEVGIIGAGAAGLSTAIEASKEGLTTVVLEEHPEVGEPLACGEGVSLAALEAFGGGGTKETELLTRKEEIREQLVSLQRFFFGNGGIANSRLKIATINKPLFERKLREHGEDLGAKFFLGASVRDLKIKKENAEIIYRQDGEKKTLAVDCIVACDGPVSRMAKKVGLETPKEYVTGVEYKIKGVHTDGMDFYINHIGELEFPHGYAWVFPKKEETNVGVVVDIKKPPREYLDKFVQKFSKSMGLEPETKRTIAGIIPASGPIPKTYSDRFLVAGDAAGFTNVVFYGGISIALITGTLAGKTAIAAHEAEDWSEEKLSIYQDNWQSKPFAEPSILTSHEIFYHKLTGEDFDNLGKLLNGIDITKVSRWKEIRVFFRLLRNRKRWYYRNRSQLGAMMDGLALSRDYCF